MSRFLSRVPALVLALCAFTLPLCHAQQAPEAPAAKPDFTADFDEMCRFVREEYAYLEQKKTDWNKVCNNLRAAAQAAANKDALLNVLEDALAQLYDNHAHFGRSNKNSPRLIPTHADLFAQWQGGQAMITDVRRDSAAARAGVLPGMQVLAVNRQPIAQASNALAPRFLSQPDPAAQSWALQTALAGKQDGATLTLTVNWHGRQQEISYLPQSSQQNTAPLSARQLPGKLAYIRIHNALGDSATIAAFDQALAQLEGSRGLILDLRDTPSGGNSQVARGIMGRLQSSARPYQMHELVAEEKSTGIVRRWQEFVVPRAPVWDVPLVVLVGRWTGSMGEGMAIGLHASRHAPVLGTPMAKLLGALGESVLPVSKIVLRIPTEKLFAIDGTPRADFQPCRVSAANSGSSADAELELAQKLLSNPKFRQRFRCRQS